MAKSYGTSNKYYSNIVAHTDFFLLFIDGLLLISCDELLALTLAAVESRNVRFTVCCFKWLFVS